MSLRLCQSQPSSLAPTRYPLRPCGLHTRLTYLQGSKRAMARLEGHDDSKALNPWSQFFAAGMGGMISQWVLIIFVCCIANRSAELLYIQWIPSNCMSISYVDRTIPNTNDLSKPNAERDGGRWLTWQRPHCADGPQHVAARWAQSLLPRPWFRFTWHVSVQRD